jgi:membrane associated rhomboid family serine protease
VKTEDGLMHDHPAETPATGRTCYRHPDRETGVRCQRCERPVCPDCLVPAPVGVQCVDCVRSAGARMAPARDLLRGRQPYVTYGLVAANVAVWLVGLILGSLAGSPGGVLSGSPLAGLGGLFGPRVAAGEWWRIITAGFLHGGLLHLAFNMVALYVFGPPLERALGRFGFAALYMTSLVAGSLGALLLSPTALTIGASGAIFGLFGAILMAQRSSGIGIRAGGMVPLLVINLVFTVLSPGVSIGGHLGGLAGGVLAGALLFNRRTRSDGRRQALAALACVVLGLLLFGAALWVAAHPF